MIRAILFDLDGVLVDASQWHERAFCQAVAEVTGVPLPHDVHAKRLEGLPTRVKIGRLIQDGRLQVTDAGEVEKRKQQYTRTLIETQCVPDPQRVALLHWASPQWTLGCVTNCIRANATLLLSKAGLLHYLPLLVSSEDAPFPKPDPYAYWHAASALRLHPQEILAVEDHPVGVEAAEKAGCHVWHLTTYRELTQEALKEWTTALPS